MSLRNRVIQRLRRGSWVSAGLVALMAFAMLPTQGAFARGQMDHLTFGAPGIPPVWLSAPFYVAKHEGFFRKYGVEVTIRPFSSGAGAGRAVAAHSIETAIVPAAPLIKMVSNANVPLVAIWGMEHPDWLIGSMSKAEAKCRDMKGQGVGVDSVGGARWIQLQRVLHSCGMNAHDVKVVSLSSNVAAAMVAGTINYGVLHLSDVPVIERESGKMVYVVKTIQQVAPGTEFTTLATNMKTLKTHRQALVRMLAGLIEAIHYMHNPSNAARVSEIVHQSRLSDSGNVSDVRKALAKYNEIHYWPLNSAGLAKHRIVKTEKILKKVGGIKHGVAPASYSRLVDGSLWKEAYSLYKRHH